MSWPTVYVMNVHVCASSLYWYTIISCKDNPLVRSFLRLGYKVLCLKTGLCKEFYFISCYLLELPLFRFRASLSTSRIINRSAILWTWQRVEMRKTCGKGMLFSLCGADQQILWRISLLTLRLWQVLLCLGQKTGGQLGASNRCICFQVANVKVGIYKLSYWIRCRTILDNWQMLNLHN